MSSCDNCGTFVIATPSCVTLKVGEWYNNANASIYCGSSASSIIWTSSKSSVASVNSTSGAIYGNGVGTAKIYATDSISGASDYIEVTVVNGVIKVGCVCLNSATLTLEKGNCAELTASISPSNATNKGLTWESSNTSVATVCDGVVTAKAKGSTWITATAVDGSGQSARCYVVVTEKVLVTSVTVSPSSVTMTVGRSIDLNATVCPEDADDQSVLWSSSDTCVATVNPTSGLVYTQGVGTATIYARAQDGSQCH